jgi:hypothetical protein
MRQASSAQSAFDKRLYKVLAIIEIRLWRNIPCPESDVPKMQVQKFDPILLGKKCVTFACVLYKNWIISSEYLEYSNKKDNDTQQQSNSVKSEIIYPVAINVGMMLIT